MYGERFVLLPDIETSSSRSLLPDLAGEPSLEQFVGLDGTQTPAIGRGDHHVAAESTRGEQLRRVLARCEPSPANAYVHWRANVGPIAIACRDGRHILRDQVAAKVVVCNGEAL